MIGFVYLNKSAGASGGRVVNLAHLVNAQMSPKGDVAILTMSVGPQIRVEGPEATSLMNYLKYIGSSDVEFRKTI